MGIVEDNGAIALQKNKQRKDDVEAQLAKATLIASEVASEKNVLDKAALKQTMLDILDIVQKLGKYVAN